jgi:hypothetical protein
VRRGGVEFARWVTVRRWVGCASGGVEFARRVTAPRWVVGCASPGCGVRPLGHRPSVCGGLCVTVRRWVVGCASRGVEFARWVTVRRWVVGCASRGVEFARWVTAPRCVVGCASRACGTRPSGHPPRVAGCASLACTTRQSRPLAAAAAAAAGESLAAAFAPRQLPRPARARGELFRVQVRKQPSERLHPPTRSPPAFQLTGTAPRGRRNPYDTPAVRRRAAARARACSCSTWRRSSSSVRRRLSRTEGAATRSAIQPKMPPPGTP